MDFGLPDAGGGRDGRSGRAREEAAASLQRRLDAAVLGSTVPTAPRARGCGCPRGRGDGGVDRTRTARGGAVVFVAPRVGGRAGRRRVRGNRRYSGSDGP